MLVLSVEENRSEAGEMALVCWVFEGTAHLMDELTCAAIYDVTIYGRDTETHNLQINYQLRQYQSIHLTIRRIRKSKEFIEMAMGYSGLFNFDIIKSADWEIIRQLNPIKSLDERSKVYDPVSYSRICLFDSEETAWAYSDRVIKEHDFNLENL